MAVFYAMKQRDYDRIRKQIDDRYRRDIEALDRVWEMSRMASAGLTKDTSDESTEGSQIPRIEGLTDAIRQVLPTFTSTFSVRDIIAKVSEMDGSLGESIAQKPASVSSALKRLERDGEISLVRKGSGKRPSDYRVTGLAEQSGDTSSGENLTDTPADL